MKELYLASYDGALHVKPLAAGDGFDDIAAALAEDDLTMLAPFASAGDPDLVMAFAYDIPSHERCGCVILFRDDEPCFALLAKTQLALAETYAHYAHLVANMRYGADIFEDRTED